MNMLDFLGGNFIEEFRLLAARPPYYETFGKYISILDCKTFLKKPDYYILDVHLKPSGHKKVAEALHEILFKVD